MFPQTNFSWKLFTPLIVFFLISAFLVKQNIVSAQTVDCHGDQDCLNLQTQIDSLSKARAQSEAATKPLQSQLSAMKVQLAQIQAQLTSLANSITQREQDIKIREDKIATEQVVLDSRVKSYYIRSFLTSPLLFLFSSGQNSDIFKQLAYSTALAAQDQNVIKSVTGEIVSLLSEKDKLETDKQNMAAFQVQVNANAKYLNGVITQAVAYQKDLSSQIANLSAKQEAVIAAKLASLNIPSSAYAGSLVGGCIDDRGVDPGFSPAFALFTYGVPNRVGLNQYGAKGRAEAGQSWQTILGAYYQNYSLTNAGNPNIHVVGTNNYGQNIDQTLSLEDYLKHIYEMPSSWHPEALKAQAVAARSYVLAATNNGANSICPSDSCQEFKQEENAGSWQDAVSATSGQVMSSGGSPIKAWFSSTHGGYVFSSSDIGWAGTSYTKSGKDTSGDVSNFSDLQSNAYDKGSPWFYCDWGSRSQYNKTAWLKPDELADIVNVIMLAQKDSSTQNHLSQLDKPNPDGTDTWDAGRVRQELQSRGGSPLTSVSSITVGWDTGSGRATSVQISGDGGTASIDAPTFKQYFNLRAPANIQIVGPLFSVEKR